MGSAISVIIELPKMQKLIDRARIGLEVSNQLFIVLALLQRRKAKLLIEFYGFRHCANSERVHSQFIESHRDDLRSLFVAILRSDIIAQSISPLRRMSAGSVAAHRHFTSATLEDTLGAMHFVFSLIALAVYLICRVSYRTAAEAVHRRRYFINQYADSPPSVHTSGWSASIGAIGRRRVGLIRVKLRS